MVMKIQVSRWFSSYTLQTHENISEARQFRRRDTFLFKRYLYWQQANWCCARCSMLDNRYSFLCCYWSIHILCNSISIVARYSGDQQRFSSNTSTDSTRYASNNRSHSESQTPVMMAQQSMNDGHMSNASNSNRNSLKDNVHSNRSSMDVSTCSYNTLIIHPDDTLHGQLNRLSSDQYGPDMKKDRPHSYGEQGMQEITEIPDDYLNQSHVLKHLAKEMKLPSNRQRMSASRERSIHDGNGNGKNPPKYEQWMMIAEQSEQNNKLRSKSQPDLSK